MNEENKYLIEMLADELSQESQCDVMLITGDMFHDMQDLVIREIYEREYKEDALLFILATPGGLIDCAYRIARAIQRNYDKAYALIPGWCKSAGTLCVIGANEIIMCDNAELGPLDVQIARRDELGVRDSGLILNEALLNLEIHAFSLFEHFLMQIKEKSGGVITFKTATEVSAILVNGLLAPIYSQIDPQRMGESARLLNVAMAYGQRLNYSTRNLNRKSLQSLTTGYPSHGFVIDRDEASLLFRRVREPSTKEAELIRALGSQASELSPVPVVKYLNSRKNTHEQNGTETGDQ